MFVDFIEGYWIDTEKCLVKYFLFFWANFLAHWNIGGENSNFKTKRSRSDDRSCAKLVLLLWRILLKPKTEKYILCGMNSNLQAVGGACTQA